MDTHTQKKKEMKLHHQRKSPSLKRRQEGKKKRKRRPQNNPTTDKKMARVCPYLSIITLNINGVKSPIEIHRLAEWILKKRLNYLLP